MAITWAQVASRAAEIATYYAKKGVVESVCGAINSGASIVYTQYEADQALFRLAEFVKFKKEGRASEYLAHFMSGAGTEVIFDTGLLLNEVKGLRERVAKCVTENSGDYGKIEVGQGAYDDTEIGQDWKNAIGSFVFDWKIASRSSGGARSIIEISGRNLYQWHPTAERWTQCVHEAGDRMTGSDAKRKAANFWMVAKPCLVSVQSWRPL